MSNISHLDCRGEERRQWIIENYRLRQAAFNKLVNGDNFPSDAGGKDITDRYYMFMATNKNNPDDTKAIICGTPTGQAFLNLLGIKGMPLFNPLKAPCQGAGHIVQNESHDSDEKELWNPAMYQLYNAVCLIPICWKQIIRNELLEIKIYCLNNKCLKPDLLKVKHVNGAILQDGNNKTRTLSEMINEEPRSINDIRDFKFDLLSDILHNNGVKPFFE